MIDLIDFIQKEWERKPDIILKATEARTYHKATDRMSYVFYYYPEMREWKREWIGALLGLSRETVSRNIKNMHVI